MVNLKNKDLIAKYRKSITEKLRPFIEERIRQKNLTIYVDKLIPILGEADSYERKLLFRFSPFDFGNGIILTKVSKKYYQIKRLKNGYSNQNKTN